MTLDHGPACRLSAGRMSENGLRETSLALTRIQTRDLYRRRARRYDATVRLLRLLGIDLERYRCDTMAALDLKPGDVVVELGCGTGLNFAHVQRKIGPTGRLIGVDLTDAMLQVAAQRISHAGWRNVELVQADLAEWFMPDGVDAAFSTLALTLVPEYDHVIRQASRALRPGGKMAVLDMKDPQGWPRWLVRLFAWLNKPFGVSLDLADRHPWESMATYLQVTTYREYFRGALYLCVATSREPRSRPLPVTRTGAGRRKTRDGPSCARGPSAPRIPAGASRLAQEVH